MVTLRPDTRLLAALPLGFALVGAPSAFAQDYPVKTVRIVTAEAGGGSDLPARVLAQALSAQYGQPVVIDNRTGGVIAGEIVSKSPPDGYTLLFYGNTLWTIHLIRKQVPYNAARDFAPLTMAIQTPLLLVVHPSLQVKSVKELIALAKARKGQLDYATASVGSGNHMAAELFQYMAGVKLVRIGHRGFTTALISTVVGETPIFFPIIGPGMEQIRAGKLKGLAVTTQKATPLAPGLPPISDTLPGYSSVFRTGVFAPAATPPALVSRLHRDIVQVLQRDDIRQKLLAMGMEVIASSPQETAAAIREEVSIMGKVIAKAGITEQ